MTTPLDVQIGGDHYKDQGIQPIEFILANGLDYCQGNVVKYTTRFRDKGGADDLKKAIHYLTFLLQDEYEIQADVSYVEPVAEEDEEGHLAFVDGGVVDRFHDFLRRDSSFDVCG